MYQLNFNIYDKLSMGIRQNQTKWYLTKDKSSNEDIFLFYDI